MKKFMKLSVLIGCFLMVAVTAVSAQDAVRNNTSCDFEVKVAYGTVAGCGVAGFATMVVPAGTQMNFGVGVEILYAKGRPTATLGTASCAFYIAQGLCAPYPLSDTITNLGCCGGYTATLIPGFGIYLN